jgi:hypothetical protein
MAESLEHLIRTKLEAEFVQTEHSRDLTWLLAAWREVIIEPDLDDWTLLLGDRGYWVAF